MVDAVLFVEGGGNDNKALRAAAREAFKRLLTRAGLSSRLPRVVPCGSRRAAYDDLCIALRGAEPASRCFLLVDAEAPVTGAPGEDAAWAHVSTREGDRWPRPDALHEDHLHLMVQVMESWFLADREAVAAYFGPDFAEATIPAETRPLESIPKATVAKSLDKAARKTPKKGYDKGRDSFALLGRLDPAKLKAASPWARRFFDVLDRLLPPSGARS